MNNARELIAMRVLLVEDEERMTSVIREVIV
jgi:hypothetical protein